MNVQQFLNERHVAFDVLAHRATYDAQRMAQAVDVPGREVAKTVLLRCPGGHDYAVAVLPATRRIDFTRAAKALGGEMVELATEIEISRHCPDCEIGALPPFGSQYGMKTIVDKSLAEDEEIVFEGNTHEEAIRMKYTDFCRLEKPQIASFTLG